MSREDCSPLLLAKADGTEKTGWPHLLSIIGILWLIHHTHTKYISYQAKQNKFNGRSRPVFKELSVSQSTNSTQWLDSQLDCDSTATATTTRQKTYSVATLSIPWTRGPLFSQASTFPLKVVTRIPADVLSHVRGKEVLTWNSAWLHYLFQKVIRLSLRLNVLARPVMLLGRTMCWGKS